MHFSFLLLTLPVAAVGALGLDPLSSRQAITNSSIKNAVRNSFIVEYAAGYSKRQEDIASVDGIKILKTYNSDIFSGASVETDVFNIDGLQALPNVARAWANERVSMAPSQPIITNDFGQYMNYTTHNSTGVNKVHAQGILGKGVKVGIVDSGTWYTHPALGGGFGPGFKVAGGWDFVGNGNWPVLGDKEPDADPLDQMGHGTHVAGIVAGKSDEFQGVAPEATIFSYKVFTQIDSTDEATLIDAFLRAYDDGMDIVTASIGVANNWADNVWAVVASRLVDQGVLVTIAAGNDGASGPLMIGNGGAGRNVLAVASLETEVLPMFPFEVRITLHNQTNSTLGGYLPSTDRFPETIINWPIVPLTLDTTIPNDGCQPWPAGTMNLTGIIPLVRRGTCTFALKQGYLEALGAEYVLFYNNDSPLITPGTIDGSSLIALMTSDMGAAIIDVYKAGGTVTGTFTSSPSPPLGIADAVANQPSVFTSWGPLYDLTMKPDIAAPGGNIFSTWLDDSWAIESGTSMATPYVAGVAALYISAHGGREVHGVGFAKDLANKIVSSGMAVSWSPNTGSSGCSASVAQVGNGLVNADKLVNYHTSLSFDKFELNDTRYFSRYHDLTITNTGDKHLTYSFTSESAAGVELLEVASSYMGLTRQVKSYSDLEAIALEPTISLPHNLTLGPGESKTVSINFDNPDTLGWNSTLLPLYSGKVIVTSDTGEILTVPYMGLGADLKRQLDPIYATGYPWSVSGVTRQSLAIKPYFTFNLSLTQQDFPVIYTELIWGSKEVRWDIYEAGWSERDWIYPPVPGENGYIGPATYWYGMEDVNYFDPRVYNPNDTLAYPVIDVQHGGPQFWWFGKLGNGSQIALGKYTMRFASLLPFGNPTHADNWDVFKTPEIMVLGKY